MSLVVPPAVIDPLPTSLGVFHKHERAVRDSLYQRALWLLCQSPNHSDRTAEDTSVRVRLVSALFEIDAGRVAADLAKMQSETPRFVTAELCDDAAGGEAR